VTVRAKEPPGSRPTRRFCRSPSIWASEWPLIPIYP
jgi:hypothetical protein